MKKVLDKFELYLLGQNEVFFYKGQKYKHQKSKRELPLDPDTLRCIKIDESGSYAGTVFLHWKTVVYIETYVFTEKERIEDLQAWENEHLWQLEQRTAYERLYKDDEDKSWSDYEPEDMWDDE